jgi:glucose/arabinose dehydrogenase
MKLSVLLLVVVSCGSYAIAQEPGSIPWTPKVSGGLVSTAIAVPERFRAIAIDSEKQRLNIPVGWTASVFAAGTELLKPRFMAWGPDSVLFVANMNRNNILALPDRNRDGIADTVVIAARGFTTGHDVRFWRDTMFVAQEASVVKLWRSDPATLIFDQRVTVIDKSSQPNQIGGGHRTRTLVVDTNAMKLYVSVGSRGNADRETNRAVIEEYNYDGSGRRVFASGVRNAVGMTLHPRTGMLWANNNGSDNQGNNIPPEWVDIVREEGFYGYPFAYHFRRIFNLTGEYGDLLPLTRNDTLALARMQPPAALVDAHSAPMALVFVEQTPIATHRYSAFMALRGSWNRTPPSGAKIVRLEFDSDEDTIANAVHDFCTGFITDTNDAATRWGRPVGLALAADGSVYISSDDIKNMIIKLTPPRVTSVGDDATMPLPTVTPNPASTSVRIDNVAPGDHVSIVDLQGNTVLEESVTSDRVTVSVATLATGVYAVRTTGVRRTVTVPLVITR